MFEKTQRKLEGILVDAGLDFLTLRDNKNDIYVVLYENIATIQHDNGKERPLDYFVTKTTVKEKQQIARQFGKVVSQSPQLLNLFFGLRLSLYLDSFHACLIRAIEKNDAYPIKGNIVHVTEKAVDLKLENNSIRRIDYDDLAFIQFLSTN